MPSSFKSHLSQVGILLLLFPLFLSSCYRKRGESQPGGLVTYSQRQLDSINFSATHHYTNKYNFVVKRDSLLLIAQQPEEYVNGMPVDTFGVEGGHLLVVSDIRTIPQDSVDTVWVQLATERGRIGWTHESALLRQVVPDDPISQFISTFSDIHMLVSLVIIVLIALIYLVHKIRSDNAKIVHFNDIDSPYPTVLVLLVSASAAFYATIQNFWPQVWQQFYFHPTLNPFAVPPVLGFFLICVWAILIVGVTCLDEVYHRMMAGEGILYLFGLLAVCAIDYIVFSVTTLYYLGYPLLLVYFWYSISRWRKTSGS